MFGKKTKEEYLADLALSVNKKLEEKLKSESYIKEVQLKADTEKVKDLIEIFGSIPDQYYSDFKEEMNNILKGNEKNKIHLMSCISSYMAYFEEHGGVPEPVKILTTCQLVLGIYWSCILLDDDLYK